MTQPNDVTAGQNPLFLPVIDSYGRLSRVPDTGELEKIETQWDDNRARIAKVGKLGLELSDGLSAWKKGVVRPDWEKLLERVRAGISQGICVWHVDRLFRRPKDLETLIELADNGFVVISSHGSRDLSDPDDRFILRIEVAHAARSSDDTQRRVKRRKQENREQGLTNGGSRALGFPGRNRRVVGERKKRMETGDALETMAEAPAEQVLWEREQIAQACQDHADGVALKAIWRRWIDSNLLSVSGQPMSPQAVAAILNRASNAGLIEHDGVIVGKMRDHENVRIIEPELFYELRAKFAARRRGNVVGEKCVASGILRCGTCGVTMYSRCQADGKRAYRCRLDRKGCGKTQGSMTGIDEQLRELVIARLSDSRYAAAISAAREAVSEELNTTTDSIERIKRIQRGLAERLGTEEIDIDEFDAANRPLSKRLKELLATRERLTGGQIDGPVKAMSAEEVEHQWKKGEIPERRVLLTRALGTDRIVLDKATAKGGNGFDVERLRLVPHQAWVKEFGE
ncbi:MULTISPECIES: recombinase family protein [unclassified Crossiella]|uniref:recombinase family protein n=1 Tax=unclassified Crossiella TaxID=2620835 RepID=UPI001FFF8FF0|nr:MULTISPECIES: recombinase family protein [unclassified Crossiella]MCK2237170.1 recombinase family protein [Crossiella sp. S99.2]MCK2252519.1 recombinase family protein [Crossiella sp. S99.1]